MEESIIILLVDDDTFFLEAYGRLLEDEGFSPLTANSSLEALHLLEVQTPAVVLLDLHMPHMDGIKTMEEIKRIDPDMPVIFLTGEGTIDAAVRATKLGAYDFLCKPVEMEKLVITLRNAIHERTLRIAQKQAEASLQKVLRETVAINACLDSILHAVNEEELLKDICRLVVEVGGYQIAWVGYAREDAEKSVQPVAQAGHGVEDYLKVIRIIWSDTEPGRGPTGVAIRSGRPAVCRNIHIDPLFGPWREETLTRGFSSSLALPLISEHTCFGALNVYSFLPDAFDDEELSMLVNLANSLSYGIMALRTRALQKRMAEELNRSLEEKVLLLQEVNHRVKNNMHVIISLIKLHAGNVMHTQLRDTFLDLENKIRSMAAIHEKLYKSKDFIHIDMKDYIEDIARSTVESYDAGKGRIALHLDIECLTIRNDTAMAVGLIIAEFLTNALKYAFPGDREGEIGIALRQLSEGVIEFILRDNGIGIPAHIDIDNGNTLGLRLLAALAKDQLKGTVEVARDKGTCFRILLPHR